jgi:multimeric flavodoxin WrbA
MKKQFKPYIMGINGSPAQTGIVASLLDSALQAAKNVGAEIRVINLYDLKIEPNATEYSLAKQPADDMKQLYPEILRADGMIFATPVYWANMSSAMKLFLERLSPLENERFSEMKGKVAMFISASMENEGGLEMATMSMVTAVLQMGFLVMPEGAMWHPATWNTEQGKVASFAETDAPKVGKEMVELCRILKEHKMWRYG